jgi:hypothetical protein
VNDFFEKPFQGSEQIFFFDIFFPFLNLLQPGPEHGSLECPDCLPRTHPNLMFKRSTPCWQSSAIFLKFPILKKTA